VCVKGHAEVGFRYPGDVYRVYPALAKMFGVVAGDTLTNLVNTAGPDTLVISLLGEERMLDMRTLAGKLGDHRMPTGRLCYTSRSYGCYNFAYHLMGQGRVSRGVKL